MRVAFFSLVVLVLAGCGRWFGTSAARREVLSEALQAQRFPISAEDATMRLRGQLAVTTRCDRFPTGEVRCGGCVRGRCFELLEEQGFTRVTTKADFTEAELTSLWQPLDAPSLNQFRTELDARVGDKLIEQEGNFVYRFNPKDKTTTAVAKDFDHPNGLCFSPDEKKLYIADSGAPHHIRMFDVQKDGILANGKIFCAIDKGVPDGIRCDANGRVFSSAGDGAQMFSPSGELIGKILVHRRRGVLGGPIPPVRLSDKSGKWNCFRFARDTSAISSNSKVKTVLNLFVR